ncbi:MAG: ABC transporter permease [Tannerella sp.]|jgi:putative ABC transport system permease protein|nr:ABC transporter permease [Tannerella sp.]
MKQFIRNFNRQRVVGLLSISSLSLGVMAAIVVGLWAINEYSFDGFHSNADRMYRLNMHYVINDSSEKMGTTFRPFGEAARAENPEIEDMSRIASFHEDVQTGDVYYPNTKVFIVDNNFFSFFSFSLKEGEPATALSAPDRAIVSESAAGKFFPGQNPIGQSLRFQGHNFTVSGIMEDMPENSSFQSDIAVSPYGAFTANSWGGESSYHTFFTLSPGADLKQTEESLTGILLKNMPLLEMMGGKATLEPMKEIHFNSGFLKDDIVKGNKSLVMALVLVAFIILTVSCINFANLFVSTSFLRARNIGVQKTFGATKGALVRDFYLETAGYVLAAIGAGVFLAHLALPAFNDFTGARVAVDLLSPRLYVFFAALFIFTVLLAGTFPALYLTRFNPVETLNGKFRGGNVSVLQKSLVIIQFSASIALLIVVSFMQKQIRLMINYDLGFDKENVLYVQGREHFGRNYEAFRDEMLQYPFFSDMTTKNSLPTWWQLGWGISREGFSAMSDQLMMDINRVRPNYFEFMDMKIIDGENPFYLESNDSIMPVVINESAARMLQLESPVDKIIYANGDRRMVIKGVMRNAHVRSLRDEVDPQVYVRLPWSGSNLIFFKVVGDPQQAIDVLRARWEEQEAGYPFEYHFLDDTYRELYASETGAGKVFIFATLITFVISVAGLFAMAFYVTRRRMREIALRKVNGATLGDLLVLLKRDFVLWVLLSFLVASPVAYFGLQSWLDGFAVKTALNGWIFLLVGAVALLVALLTTSVQTWKVATTNPVEMLKGE